MRSCLALKTVEGDFTQIGPQVAKNQLKSGPIRPGRRTERLLFSPKQTFTDSDLDSVRMAAFGQKQPFGLSLDRSSLTSALEKKTDIRVLELRARVNCRNRPVVVVRLSLVIG